MKSRAPVDRYRLRVEQIAPSTQAMRRDVEGGRVVSDPQTAPVQRFDMHRPERLDCLRLLADRQRFALPTATFEPFLQLDFHRRMQGFVAHQHLQPARERRLRKAMTTTVTTLRQAAPAPRLDVDRPPFAPRLVLEVSRPHRRSSHVRRNPIWTAKACQQNCAGTGCLQPNRRTAR